MEKLIKDSFDIKDIKENNFPSINVAIKNTREDQICFDIKDYSSKTNFFHINMEHLNPKFFNNDSIKIKCAFKGILLQCIDPFFDRNIENDIWTDIGITNRRNNKNYILLQTNVNDINYIILISFQTLEKNMMIKKNNPVEIILYLKNTEEIDKFINDFENIFSKLFEIPKNKIINVKINKNLLISCCFTILPLENKNNCEICDKLLDLYTINKTINKYNTEEILKLNNYFIIIENILHIESIKFYCENLFNGIQIQSDKFDIYNNKVYMEYEKKKNNIIINYENIQFKSLIQLKDNNSIISYTSDLPSIILDNNILFINSDKSFNIEITIKKGNNNILIPNSFNNIEICEINKFTLNFNLKKKKIFDNPNKLLKILDVAKFKILMFSIVIGIFSGIIYSKIQDENDKESNLTFIPNCKNNKMNKEFVDNSINEIKYEKYYLNKDFFSTTDCSKKDTEILNNLNKYKNKPIFKKFK